MTHTIQQPRMPKTRQQGFTLLELMVGMLIGLMITGVALGTLMLTRATSSTISEVAQLQQQASYALQIIGAHIRQAGSYELSLNTVSTGTFSVFTFTDYPKTGVTRFGGSNGSGNNPDTLIVGTKSFAGMRDCKGIAVTTEELTTTFDLVNNELRCNSSASINSGAQAIIKDVADFQVRYRNYTRNAVGNKTFHMADTASTITDTGITAIEVCLELRGTETLPTSTETYTNCRGQQVAIGSTLRRVFRNIYHVRVTE